MGRTQSKWKVVNEMLISSPDSDPHAQLAFWTMHHSGRGCSIERYPVIKKPDYVQVVGITNKGKIVLILEDKVANGPSIEAIAGEIEPHESPEKSALREFNEETEFSATASYYLGSNVAMTNRYVSSTPGNNGAKTGYLFIAFSLSKSAPRPSAHEVIQTVVLDFDVALDCAMHAPKKTVPGYNLPILSTATQSIIKSIRLVPTLYKFVSH